MIEIMARIMDHVNIRTISENDLDQAGDYFFKRKHHQRQRQRTEHRAIATPTINALVRLGNCYL
jgi:hypothetical protein